MLSGMGQAQTHKKPTFALVCRGSKRQRRQQNGSDQRSGVQGEKGKHKYSEMGSTVRPLLLTTILISKQPPKIKMFLTCRNITISWDGLMIYPYFTMIHCICLSVMLCPINMHKYYTSIKRIKSTTARTGPQVPPGNV